MNNPCQNRSDCRNRPKKICLHPKDIGAKSGFRQVVYSVGNCDGLSLKSAGNPLRGAGRWVRSTLCVIAPRSGHHGPADPGRFEHLARGNWPGLSHLVGTREPAGWILLIVSLFLSLFFGVICWPVDYDPARPTRKESRSCSSDSDSFATRSRSLRSARFGRQGRYRRLPPGRTIGSKSFTPHEAVFIDLS